MIKSEILKTFKGLFYAGYSGSQKKAFLQTRLLLFPMMASIQEAEEPEWDHVTHPHLNLIGHDIAARYALYLLELLAFFHPPQKGCHRQPQSCLAWGITIVWPEVSMEAKHVSRIVPASTVPGRANMILVLSSSILSSLTSTPTPS